MHVRQIIVASVTVFLFASGSNAGTDHSLPSSVDSTTTNDAVKLLPAGQKLCAQAQKDCANITADEFGAMAAGLGMPTGTEIKATGKAALREAQGTCDVTRVNGVFETHHNAAGIPTAVYLFPYQTSSDRPVKWGTGFVCVLQNH
ncbi:MAG TPA: hypothetical protein VGT78_00715 [Rhizomicrobium sp.]|nr:hypothetical protein [Rhizomicrobium sp.]